MLAISSINAARPESATWATCRFSLIIGRFIMGYLVDRIFAPILMIAIVAAAIAGLIMMLIGVAGPAAIVSISLIGFTIGADTDCLAYLVSRYIGLRVYTRAFGVLLAIFTGGVAAGPAIMGFSAKHSGSYNLGLQILIATTAISMIPFLLMGRYPDEGERGTTWKEHDPSDSHRNYIDAVGYSASGRD